MWKGPSGWEGAAVSKQGNRWNVTPLSPVFLFGCREVYVCAQSPAGSAPACWRTALPGRQEVALEYFLFLPGHRRLTGATLLSNTHPHKIKIKKWRLVNFSLCLALFPVFLSMIKSVTDAHCHIVIYMRDKPYLQYRVLTLTYEPWWLVPKINLLSHIVLNFIDFHCFRITLAMIFTCWNLYLFF